ncbi:regulatory protein RecX [Jatrophihabitans fulvus]
MRSAEELVAELNAREAAADAAPGPQQARDAAAGRMSGTRGGPAARDTARRGTTAERLGGPTAERPASRRTSRPAARRSADDTPAPPPEDTRHDPPGDPAAVARIVCLRLLERRARSRSELEQALAKREIPSAVAAAVLDRFTEVGLIDDAELAVTVAGAQHRERGLARRAIATKLRQRGFDDDTVREAVAGIDADDERRRAEALVARKLRSLSALPAEVRMRRLVGLLARKGYSSGLAYEVVRAAVAESDADPAAESGFLEPD